MDIFFFFIFDEEANTTVPVKADIENDEELEFFFDDKVRKVWHKQKEEWYFSIVDVCQVLTDSLDGRKYWNKLKQRLKSEGNETVTNCHQLKMKAAGGKMRKTDCASTEQLLRITQSIPSKKAEPFKQWLALVGKERLGEIADPELAFERMIHTYRAKGYSEKWIQERLRVIDVRNPLTDERTRTGAKVTRDYATFTNISTHAWSGKTVKEYKEFKHLHKENLRYNMTNIELALNQLAEVSATALSKAKNPSGMSETKRVAREGVPSPETPGKNLNPNLEKSVISPLNVEEPNLLDKNYDEN